MIGSIDMLATISRMPVASIATIGRLSGINDHPPDLRPFACGGRLSSRIKKVGARKVMKMTPPAHRKVARIPIKGGSAPPIRGPRTLPAMMPDDSTPSAQPERALGVCAATRIIEPDV